MPPEMIAILGVGIALAGMILHGKHETNRAIADVRKEIADLRTEMADLRKEIADLRKDMADLRERMARVEGLFEGFTGRKPPMAAE